MRAVSDPEWVPTATKPASGAPTATMAGDTIVVVVAGRVVVGATVVVGAAVVVAAGDRRGGAVGRGGGWRGGGGWCRRDGGRRGRAGGVARRRRGVAGRARLGHGGRAGGEEQHRCRGAEAGDSATAGPEAHARGSESVGSRHRLPNLPVDVGRNAALLADATAGRRRRAPLTAWRDRPASAAAASPGRYPRAASPRRPARTAEAERRGQRPKHVGGRQAELGRGRRASRRRRAWRGARPSGPSTSGTWSYCRASAGRAPVARRSGCR